MLVECHHGHIALIKGIDKGRILEVMETKGDYPYNWFEIANHIKQAAEWKCEGCGCYHGDPYQLTVHHINYNPANCLPENLIALCQSCHLKVQHWRVQPTSRDEIIRRIKAWGKQLNFEFV